ncbi:hypothetical protein KAS79_03880 [Candidatus Parcubacteria bacterium]|nr:hypothetical protein [Candidatus Parcubacteria bacterium]
MKRKNFLFLILAIGGMILSQAVFADAPGIGLSPLTFEITGNPGDVIENYIKVGNPSSEHTISVKMTIEDIVPTGESGHVIVEPAETESYSLARWTKCEHEKFILTPKEEKKIKFTIRIPENAEPGGHYGTVIAGSTGVTGPGITGASIIPRVGALVLLTVPGEMKENLIVKEFSAPRNYFEYGPIPFEIKFENLGTIHSRASASISITDLQGKKVAEIPLVQKSVLPSSVRKFEASWNQKWLWGGKYIATLSGTYGAGNIPLESKVITFWAFPWKVVLGLLIFIILLILTRRRWAAAVRILIRGESR